MLRSVLLALAYVFFDRRRSLVFCVVAVLASYFVETHLKVGGFFSTSGAIVSLAGLYLNIKYSLNFHLKITPVAMYNKLAGAGIWGTGQISAAQQAWVDGILKDEMYGASFMIVGTLIWAYGSYLIGMFS